MAKPSFAAALRERTASLHVVAERTGVISDLLKGRSSPFAYALLLRNLFPAYEQMESGLDRHRADPGVGRFARPELYRADALAADLDSLRGPSWREALPLLPAGENYAKRVTAAGEGDGSLLIAHAYARYLGDLSGGQILKRLLGRTLELEPDSLRFYDFPAITDAQSFKAAYREAIDLAGQEIADSDAVLEEAATAFQLNIDLSDAVRAAAA